MPLDLADPRTARLHAALSPYLRVAFERAADLALALHADAVTLEHLLLALLRDEDSAAHRVVLHAFADPDTLAAETLALAPGILVVGSGSSLPFSALGVRCLFRARELAAASASPAVESDHLLAGALEFLPVDVRQRLGVPNSDGERPARAQASKLLGGRDPARDGSVFSEFSSAALRALGLASRTAHRLGRQSISPGHVVQSCLESDAALAGRAGLSSAGARAALAGRDDDATPPTPRKLSADPTLAEFLSELPDPAGSLSVLEAVYRSGPMELGQILKRSKITPELLARTRADFEDPRG